MPWQHQRQRPQQKVGPCQRRRGAIPICRERGPATTVSVLPCNGRQTLATGFISRNKSSLSERANLPGRRQTTNRKRSHPMLESALDLRDTGVSVQGGHANRLHW